MKLVTGAQGSYLLTLRRRRSTSLEARVLAGVSSHSPDRDGSTAPHVGRGRGADCV